MIREFAYSFPAGQKLAGTIDYVAVINSFAIECIREKNKVMKMGLIEKVIVYAAGIATAVYVGNACDKAPSIADAGGQAKIIADLRIDELRNAYCADNSKLSLEDCVRKGVEQYLPKR